MSSPTPRTRSVAAASCAASRVSQLTAAADALTSNEDCWLLVGEAILRTHDLQVYASWRLASKACLGAWQHSFDATAPWLSIWPANLERYLWQASVPHFDGESGGGPGCHSFDHGEGRDESGVASPIASTRGSVELGDVYLISSCTNTP